MATQVVAGAIDRACKDGKASRAEVRAQLKKTNIAAEGLAARPAASRSTANGDLKQHRFGIYQSKNGVFVRVGVTETN